MSKQKTWTELLGPHDPKRDVVSGRDIVRLIDADTYHYIVWHFDTAEQAQAAFEAWREGK